MLPGNGEQRNQITFTCVLQQLLYSDNVLPNNRSPPRQGCPNSSDITSTYKYQKTL
jgi:hypothetical protein